MKLIHTVLALACTLTVSSAGAATIWAPTNVDTDFIQLDVNSIIDAGISTNGGTLALFDDDDFGGDALIIGDSGGQVVFSDNGDTTWTAEVFDSANVSGGSITLSDNAYFMLGVDWGAGYYGDSNYDLTSSPDTYLIVFDGFGPDQRNASGSTLAVDLAPIPVPAAVWLFVSGLLGLVAVGRRNA